MLKPDAARLAATLLACTMLAGCPGRIEDSSEFRAACHGDRLATTERRNAAMEDGHAINRQFDCIDKASYIEATEIRAREAAARTPEAIARREAEQARENAERRARVEAAAAAEVPASREPVAPAPVARVEANTAPESVLAAMQSVGPAVAAQIVAARSERPFRDWADLVGRVIGLRAAGPAMRASMGGLTVAGQPLEGLGPPAGYLP